MIEDAKNILRGIAAAPGIAISEAYLYKKDIEEINHENVINVEEAKNNLFEALEKSKHELKKVFSLAVDKLGPKRAAIFEAQLMILDDPILIDTIVTRIETEKKSSEFIVNDEISKYQKMMLNSRDPHMSERSQDIEDIKNRIIKNIKKRKWISRITPEKIIVTSSITPVDAVLFNRVNSVGFITDFGGLTSHAAIVARSLNIPAVLGVHEATTTINHNDKVIVDGFNGLVIINPDQEQIKFYERKLELLQEDDLELRKIIDLPSETLDGVKVSLQGNLDLPQEMEIMISNGAEGIGLVRTEQLLGDLDEFPDEEEQLKYYSKIAETIYPNNVVIRTFDIGGDKVLPVDVQEDNPFLGWRGIRFLLDNVPLLKTQLKAILRAGIHNNIQIMFPMVASIKEVYRVKKIMETCKAELDKEGKGYGKNIQIGVMIEVPSAVMIAKDLAEEVDFFSIGTNDLIQYTLAVDRGNEIVSDLYQEFHPAIIRSLKEIIRRGKKGKINVSLCGEMAADPLAVPLLVGLGIDALSVSPAALPQVKRIIRNIKYSDVKKLAKYCLKLKTEGEIKQYIYNFYKTKLTHCAKDFFEDE